ncbi:phospholipase D-like domain-containing protein [Corynebacterium mendelii]|uniref:PLDc N-terminal domain-containing protein n=1 Tax=Corynebacterium mendelii TaxID=2765362 RepID=A0A939IUP2_9CORY|nr:phospholipase D-like domain-containing protein [Corynebacterium mendelii]MBN9645139.1 PLDc N-terminal domain-containing protein [Corynebacterium mendelii]
MLDSIEALAHMEWWQLALLALEYIIKILAIGIVPGGQKPGSSSAWLLAILFVPVIGLPLYLLMGSKLINDRRHDNQVAAAQVIGDPQKHMPDLPPDAALAPTIDTIVRLNRHLTGVPAGWAGVDAILPDSRKAIARMARIIDGADSYVYVEFYILAWDTVTDPFFRALERAVDRGVDVKVLFDQVGSWKYPGYRQLGQRLDAIGVQWHLTQPLAPWRWRFRRPDLRNHRKMLIVDGQIGFIGSQNLIDPSYLSAGNVRIGREWVDVLVELSGSVLASMEQLFAIDWYLETGEKLAIAARPYNDDDNPDKERNLVQLVPSGPGYQGDPNLKMFVALIHQAQHQIIMCSPYFIPDESLMQAVTAACYRGVEVHLLVCEESDQFMVGHAQASYYRALLEAGVIIHLYPKPMVLHTKYLLVDPDGSTRAAVVGSSNMDMRSFGLNYEVSLFVAEGSLIDQLHDLTHTYCARSRILSSEEWSQRTMMSKYLDNAMRLTSALQ